MKKALSVLLLIALVLTFALASCDDKKPAESEAASAPATSVDETSQAQGYVKVDKFYEGETLRILGKPEGKHFYSTRQWTFSEDLIGEAINDAVYERNNRLFEDYGVSVVYTALQTPGAYFINEAVRLFIDSNLDEYDVVCDGLQAMAPLAQQASFYELSSADYIDLSKEWWDNSVTEYLSILGKTYFAAGDILITDDEYTYCTIFNKTMFKDYDLGAFVNASTMYELVDSGRWTYDAMHTMALQVGKQLDADSAMTKYDQWGIISDIGAIYYMMAASGYSMSGVENGEPYLRVQSEDAVNLFMKVNDFMNDSTCSIYAERIGGDRYYADAEEIFGEGRGLFSVQKINGVNSFASNFEVDFGVAPMPKATEDQEKYYNPAAYIHFSAIGIPITNAEGFEKTCVSLEALAAYGRELLTPAYIETTLKLKKLQDDNDSRMIDMVINNRTFDLATIYNWGDLNGFYAKFAGTGNTDIISAYDAVKQAAQIALEKTVEDFRKIED